MGKVAAGRLNKRITFQRKSSTTDDWGQPLQTWTDYATVWANIRTITGSGFVNHEFEAGGTEVSRGTASIRIRKRTDLNAYMRVSYAGNVYDIKSILPDEEGDEYLDVAVAFGANEG